MKPQPPSYVVIFSTMLSQHYMQSSLILFIPLPRLPYSPDKAMNSVIAQLLCGSWEG